MRIIPAIDIIDGKCVRLSQGDYATKKVYNEHPLEVALQFEAHGVHHLHLVDLDGAKANHIVNHKVLETLATRTGLKIDFGGGLKSGQDVKLAFECGASQITGGSIAVKDSTTFLGWLKTYGPERIILGADARHGQIAVSGWVEATGENLFSFIKGYAARGIKYVICTDIAKDGMLAGPAVADYRKIIKDNSRPETGVSMSEVEDRLVPEIHLIASGGISSLEDLRELKSAGCEGAILGKALYEQRISLKELENFILN